MRVQMMFELLKFTRRPRHVRPAQFFLHGAIALACGLILGVLSKLLDVHTQNIGNIFSGVGIWIFICTLISVRSPTPFSAAFSVLVFCIGMLVTYYSTAEVCNLVYNRTYVIGWTAFALCSPVIAYVAWYAGGRGPLAITLSCGIIFVMLISTHVLFGLQFYDILIALVTAIFLFGVRKRLSTQRGLLCGVLFLPGLFQNRPLKRRRK